MDSVDRVRKTRMAAYASHRGDIWSRPSDNETRAKRSQRLSCTRTQNKQNNDRALENRVVNENGANVYATVNHRNPGTPGRKMRTQRRTRDKRSCREKSKSAVAIQQTVDDPYGIMWDFLTPLSPFCSQEDKESPGVNADTENGANAVSSITAQNGDMIGSEPDSAPESDEMCGFSPQDDTHELQVKSPEHSHPRRLFRRLHKPVLENSDGTGSIPNANHESATIGNVSEALARSDQSQAEKKNGACDNTSIQDDHDTMSSQSEPIILRRRRRGTTGVRSRRYRPRILTDSDSDGDAPDDATHIPKVHYPGWTPNSTECPEQASDIQHHKQYAYRGVAHTVKRGTKRGTKRKMRAGQHVWKQAWMDSQESDSDYKRTAISSQECTSKRICFDTQGDDDGGHDDGGNDDTLVSKSNFVEEEAYMAEQAQTRPRADILHEWLQPPKRRVTAAAAAAAAAADYGDDDGDGDYDYDDGNACGPKALDIPADPFHAWTEAVVRTLVDARFHSTLYGNPRLQHHPDAKTTHGAQYTPESERNTRIMRAHDRHRFVSSIRQFQETLLTMRDEWISCTKWGRVMRQHLLQLPRMSCTSVFPEQRRGSLPCDACNQHRASRKVKLSGIAYDSRTLLFPVSFDPSDLYEAESVLFLDERCYNRVHLYHSMTHFPAAVFATSEVHLHSPTAARNRDLLDSNQFIKMVANTVFHQLQQQHRYLEWKASSYATNTTLLTSRNNRRTSANPLYYRPILTAAASYLTLSNLPALGFAQENLK
jgi:Domain of unknown function (DUF4211)